MAASGEQIAKAYVAIEADLSNLPAGLNKLSATVTAKILDLQKKTAAQLARNQLEMKVAVQQGDFKAITSLGNAATELRAKLDRVNQAAVNQAAALAAMGGAANRAATAQENLGGAASRSGRSLQQGAMSGAMGLMALSQAIDDAQYGFRSVVNQIPQLGMGLASLFGASSEAAMKFGAVAGIVAVALNVLITHWDDLLNAVGLGKILTEAEAMDKLAKATRRTADEQERLNRYKRDQQTIEEMSGKRSSGEEQTEAAVKAVLADFGNQDATGFDRIAGALASSRVAQGRGEKMMPDEREAVRDAKKGATPTLVDRWVDPVFGALNRWSGGIVGDHRSRATKQEEINRRVDEANVERAKRDVSAAMHDPLKRQELIAEMRMNPGAFPEGAAAKLERVNPAQNATDKAKEDAERAHRDRVAEFDLWKSREMRGARENEDSRLANAMMGSVGEKYLRMPGMDDATLQGEVKKAMQQAGMSAQDIAEAMKGTAKKIRENMDEAVRVKALGRDDHNEGKARAELVKEAQAKDDKGLSKSEVMSTSSYLNKVLVAGLSKSDTNVPKDQLAEAKKHTELLGGVIKELAKPKPNTFATFGPRR